MSSVVSCVVPHIALQTAAKRGNTVHRQALFTDAVCLSKRIFCMKMKERRIDFLLWSSWRVYFRSDKIAWNGLRQPPKAVGSKD
jgi:hypothetical protein